MFFFCLQVKYAPKVHIHIKSGVNGKIPEGEDAVIGNKLYYLKFLFDDIVYNNICQLQVPTNLHCYGQPSLVGVALQEEKQHDATVLIGSYSQVACS